VKDRVCKICRKNPAKVPDRDRPQPRRTPEICVDCHARMLANDLFGIAKRWASGRER
jgi:hypothetical protein